MGSTDACRGICRREEVPYGHSNYVLSKRCIGCSQWFSPVRKFCPCCGNILRDKPRFKNKGRQRDFYQQKLPPKAPWLVSKY